MIYIPYKEASYCPECDIIYKAPRCPLCCNKNGASMNCIRNRAAKLAEDYKALVGEPIPVNVNQTSLF